MPRRAVLTEGQRDAPLALPDTELELVRHWTLSAEDLRVIISRRRPHNRLGFAVQLCALRYPGRLLRPGELIGHTPLAFVADQLDVAPDVLADYAVRGPTRYEQLDTLRDVFGFRQIDRPTRVALQAWLLPIALTPTNGADLARVLLSEFRVCEVIVPGITLWSGWWRRRCSTPSGTSQSRLPETSPQPSATCWMGCSHLAPIAG